MKAIILIELDEEHLIQQTNDLYDRLEGYKCDLKSLPEFQQYRHSSGSFTRGFTKGWNSCLKYITGETE